MFRSAFITKKLIALTIAVLLTICLFGCGTEQSTESTEKPGTVISETENDFVMVDQAGREVTVKKDVKSIALCYRVVTRMLISLGQADKIVGSGRTDDFIDILAPEMTDVPDVGMGVPDIEELAEVNPDLYFGNARDIEGLEALEEIGISAIGVSIETPDEIMTALELVGKACGQEERVAELKDYYNGELEKTEELAKKIKDKDRKTAIVMGSSMGKIAHGSMLQGEMLELAGATNCAAELQASEIWPTAGMEQIFEWDPEYIFISHSKDATYTVEDILNDPSLSELKAVKNKNVYLMPSDLDSWELPGLVSVLGIDYMMHVMYPELLSDEELEQKKDDFYNTCYGRTFSREELGY